MNNKYKKVSLAKMFETKSVNFKQNHKYFDFSLDFTRETNDSNHINSLITDKVKTYTS
jgi:hypothetical protein